MSARIYHSDIPGNDAVNFRKSMDSCSHVKTFCNKGASTAHQSVGKFDTGTIRENLTLGLSLLKFLLATLVLSDVNCKNIILNHDQHTSFSVEHIATVK